MLDNQERDERARVETSVDIKCTLAGAYVCLLDHFSTWRKVAEHLDMSASTACNHYRQAEILARRQYSLPSPLPKGFMPGSWRSRRPGRPIRQLVFEFAYQLALPLPAIS